MFPSWTGKFLADAQIQGKTMWLFSILLWKSVAIAVANKINFLPSFHRPFPLSSSFFIFYFENTPFTIEIFSTNSCSPHT